MQRLKTRIGEVLVPGSQTSWPDVCAQLNRLLRGWSTYFSHGTRRAAYRAIDNHVYQNVRYFLIRRYKMSTRGITRFPAEAVFGKLGVLRLRRVHLGALPCA